MALDRVNETMVKDNRAAAAHAKVDSTYRALMA